MENLKKIIIADEIEISIPIEFEKNLDKQLNVEPEIKEKIVDNASFMISEDEAEINFTFVDEQLKTKNMEEAIKNIYVIFSRLVPGFNKIEILHSKINGIEAGAILYKSNGLTNDLFNMYILYNFNDKNFVFNANCKYDRAEKWQLIFFDIAESVRRIG